MVPPPNKSDSFATDPDGKKVRVQHREIDGTNFRIVGVDLTGREEVLDQAARILGMVPTVGTGDASTANERACYRSIEASTVTYLLFDRGEFSPSFTLTSDGSGLDPRQVCRRTNKITRDTATASGLRLGQTQDQVTAILGLPTTHRRNPKFQRDDLKYQLSLRKKAEPADLAKLLKLNPNMPLKEFHESFDFYDLSEFVHAIFIDDHLTSLTVDWSAMS